MKHPEYNKKYYYTVEWCRICKKIVPGWYYNVIPTFKTVSQSKWFISIYPNYPTYKCSLGYVVEVISCSLGKNKGLIKEKIVNKWIYIDIGKNADLYKYPLGLHFYRGIPENMNKNIKQIIIYLATNYSEDNIISEEESDLLVKDKKIVKPFESITKITLKKHFATKEQSEIAYKYFYKKREKEEKRLQKKLQKRYEACQRKYERRRLRELKKQEE